MSKDNNLFPEKEIMDMKFIDLVKFGNIDIKNKEDSDKALHELSLLKNKQRELSGIQKKHEDALALKIAECSLPIFAAIRTIEENIQRYYDHHLDEFEFIDGEAKLQFKHGEIIAKQKTEVKIKTNK